MTQFEIHKKIEENNKKIEDLLTPNQFTLNNLVKDLLKENESLQNQCKHEFVDGYCICCYLGEEDIDED